MATDDGRDSRSPSLSRQDDSIASHHQTCQAFFMKCLKALQTAKNNLRGEERSLPLESQVDRYCIWFKNIAAHQDAKLPSSLEYRICEDENAIRIVKKALIYLAESLEMLLMILTGEKENETWNSTSELAELSLSIEEGITSLFELSMIIRKKPEKDEYIKAALATSYDPTPDIVHVGDKYPLARSRDAWLMERLGTAITRRRQYLRYRKDHQEKMEQIHEIKKDADGKTVWSGEKASTYLHGDILGKSAQNNPMPSDLSSTVLGKRPQTEYADSSKGKDGALDLLRTPLLPKDANGMRVEYGQYFECPYCWRPLKVQNKTEWKKHIFSDLRPYVCTFENCGLNMHESQHQWFDHEVRFHRELWLCKFCKGHPPKSRSDLETHLKNTHADRFSKDELEPLLDSCAINRIDATCCPLCTTYGSRLQIINQSPKCDVSLKQFQEHLGRHMEQLALAALPEEDLDERDTNEDDPTSDEQSSSTSLNNDVASSWIPQATPEGELFYYNTMTGESSMDPPPNTSLENSAVPPLFNDASSSSSLFSRDSRSIILNNESEKKKRWRLSRENRNDFTAKTLFPEIPGEVNINTELGETNIASFANPLPPNISETSTSSTPVAKPKRTGFLRSFFNRVDRFDDSVFRRGEAIDFPEIPGEIQRNPDIRFRTGYSKPSETETERPSSHQQRKWRETLEVPAPYHPQTQTPSFDSNRSEPVATLSSTPIKTSDGIMQERETRERNNFEHDSTDQESISPPHSLMAEDSHKPGIADDFLPPIRGPREIMRERATRDRDVKIEQESMEVDRELRRIVQERKNLEQISKEEMDRKEVSLRESLRKLDERRLATISDSDFISRRNLEGEGADLEDSMNKIPRKSEASKFTGKTWSSHDSSTAAMDPEESHIKVSGSFHGLFRDPGEGHRNQEPRESYNKNPEIETGTPSRQE